VGSLSYVVLRQQGEGILATTVSHKDSDFNTDKVDQAADVG
jgi:hypothetical protein